MTKSEVLDRINQLRYLANLELKLWDTPFCGDVELTALAKNRLRLYDEAENKLNNTNELPHVIWYHLKEDDKFNKGIE